MDGKKPKTLTLAKLHMGIRVSTTSQLRAFFFWARTDIQSI